MHHQKSTYSLTLLLLLTFLATAYIAISKISKPRRYTIGLVYIPTRAFPEYVNARLIDTIRHDKRFIIKEFTAAGGFFDLNMINSACNEAISSDVDLIITTGLHCSKSAIVTAIKRESTKPIIFMGVTDVINHELVKSLQKPEGYATGIESNSPFANDFSPADLLGSIKQKVNTILLPYATFVAESLDTQAKLLQRSCKHSGQKITLLPINHLGETLSKVVSLLPNHNALLYLEGDAISPHAPGLGKLASQHNVTMLAGSIDGIKDSALSYAADPACLADIAFEIAKEILINKKKPGDIPVRQERVPRNLIINTKLCQEQDLANIDIPAVVQRIRSDERFAAVHDHIIVDGVVV